MNFPVHIEIENCVLKAFGLYEQLEKKSEININ